tara:strand:- start:33 stop:185 length:153 start_codon:yes stop_codon:yes gene_type:complete
MFNGPNGVGKGDKPRMGISATEWAKRWDKIFGNKNKNKRKKVKESGKRSK